jgi:RNA polymerase sigma-70 factor (ECF subfamily)
MTDSSANFAATRWTLVLQAGGRGEPAQAALADLCGAYYEPVVAFLRREGRDADTARETAHAFFESVLTGGMGNPEPGRGRFRSYLLGALKHFLANQRAANLASKRGGRAEHVPLAEESETAPGLPLPAAPEPPPEVMFDREWAFTLIARALAALEAEHAGKPEWFATLKPWLDSGGTGPQALAASRLGLTETAVKVAIHRLRTRFRELIRNEIAATLHEPAEAADELRHLIEIAARG